MSAELACRCMEYATGLRCAAKVMPKDRMKVKPSLDDTGSSGPTERINEEAMRKVETEVAILKRVQQTEGSACVIRLVEAYEDDTNVYLVFECAHPLLVVQR